MSETWGKGTLNNTIGWGQGACDNTINWGKSQKDSSVAASWSGDTDISGCSGAAGLAQIDNLNSMSFDGINDFIKVREFNNSSTAEGIILGNITISLWFKIGIGINYAHSNFVGGSNSTNSGLFQYFGVHNGFPEMYFQNDGGYTALSSTNVYDDTWHHIAINYDASVGTYGTFKAYLDGVNTFTLALSGSPTSPNWSRNRMLVIGGYRDTPFRNFPGSIDEVANFNVVLTEAEILSIYNATAVVDGVKKTADLSQLTTPPVAWYRM